MEQVINDMPLSAERHRWGIFRLQTACGLADLQNLRASQGRGYAHSAGWAAARIPQCVDHRLLALRAIPFDPQACLPTPVAKSTPTEVGRGSRELLGPHRFSW